MTYDFKRLSGVDFEELVHDLLQQVWGIDLEIFAGGRDGGVDLRSVDANGLLVVQCKNYEGSGYAALRGKMRDDEIPKIERLGPHRYVLVTSVDLTVGQKDELTRLLSPWVRTSGDVIGKSELEALLLSNETVVRRHHKLWLTSIPVMEQILLGAERVQTEAEVARMQRKLDVYVETDALARAVQILNEHHVLIVSGEPGIGKSTLADMIILDHIANGYRPAVIRSSLSEGRRMAASGLPTVFYFDDFLGQTYLGDRPDFLGKREDADLVDFIEWVRSSGHHRFVLTTREHVLTEALMRSERLRHAGLGDERCLITIADLSRAQRARILYNHLEFSGLPLEYKMEMLKDDFFLEVIDFERFNPRVIQWLSSFSRLKSVPPKKYQDHVRALMTNPLEIWRHAYEHELSQAARDVLVALYSFTYNAYVEDLERCFDRLHAASVRRLNERTTTGAFKSAMKELEGSFITITPQGKINFINPSIADFVATVLRDDVQLALDLIDAAVLFTQVSMIVESAEGTGPLAPIMDRIKAAGSAIANAFDRTLLGPRFRWINTKEGRFGYPIDLSRPNRASRLLALRSIIPEVLPVAERAIAIVASEVDDYQVDPSEAESLLTTAWDRRRDRGWEAVEQVVVAVRKALRRARAADWLSIMDLRTKLGDEFEESFPEAMQQFEAYLKGALIDERLDCDTTDAASELVFYLEQLHERHGIDVKYELECVSERLAELEEKESGREETSDDFFESWASVEEKFSDDSIRSMFGGLLG